MSGLNEPSHFLKQEKEVRKSGIVFLVILAVVATLTSSAFAQNDDERRGLFSVQLGGTSNIGSSEANKFNIGGSFAYRLFESRNFYIEPGLSLNWPSKEYLFVEEYPYPVGRISSKTVIVDFNASQSFVGKRQKRCVPYLTGGIGFIRNWSTLTDGYYVYDWGSDTSFTKNLGAGFRIFLGEDQNVFVGGEYKNYWAGDTGSFHVFSGKFGLRFE
ncbi:MAG: hypothetical protein HYT63_01860 [Candidatus Yanofskybacteria bacterium]|nr:hypothetical protein [Candidatus Yanofskybacteria bacterium]